ncbi:m134 protein [Murid betaherpesvirus 1]|nr:m134 protein [Murid betaherpesvirus 1]
MAVDVTNNRSIDTLVNLVQREGVRAHVLVPGGASQKPRGGVVVRPVVLYQVDATFDRKLFVAARGFLPPAAAAHERGDRHHQNSGRQQYRGQGGAGQHDGLSGQDLRGRRAFCSVDSSHPFDFAVPFRVLGSPTMSHGVGGPRTFYSLRRSGIVKFRYIL